MTRYTDLRSGKQIFLTADVSAGINLDVDGNIYNFINTTGNNWFDVNSGVLIVASAAASYLLDTYPAFAAYSVRQLSSTATNSLRVRRTSDNAEQDIGFSGGWLDESALVTFADGATLYVVKWYDQSGSGYDASQATTGNQADIYTVATGVRYENGKPCTYTTNSGRYYDTSSFSSAQSQPCTYFTVTRNDSYVAYPFGWSNASSEQYLSTSQTSFYIANAGSNLLRSPKTSGQEQVTTLFNTTTSLIRSNGSQVGLTGNLGTEAQEGLRLGSNSTGAGTPYKWQELIMYNSDQTDNIAAIESDINAAFSVY